MENKKFSKGLKGLLAVCLVLLVLFAVLFVALAALVSSSGDPELPTFVAVVKYHLSGVLDLFAFKYAGPSNFIYFGLSALLYALIVCWVIFLIGAILINSSKETNVIYWGVALNLFGLGVYAVLASGTQKYWQILNGRDAYEPHGELAVLLLALLGVGFLYSLLAVIFYFATIARAYAARKAALKESKIDLREIVREELQKTQKNFYLVNQQPQIIIIEEEDEVIPQEKPAPVAKPEPVIVEEKQEPQPEPQPQPEPEPVVEEEPQQFNMVDFWEVAMDVWPQLNNPHPLPQVQAEPEDNADEEVESEDEDSLDNLKKHPREPFAMRILKADLDIKANYNEIKNEILSYGVKSRLSRTGDVFRLHTKKYVKIFLVGKTLKVYLALNPEDYKDSTFPVEDVGFRPNYAEIPLLFKVRSGLSVRRCKELIKAACEKDGLTKKEIKDINWVSELRTLNAEKARENKNRISASV